MSTSTCIPCDKLERRIAELEEVVREQQAIIDELQALKPVKKKKAKRKPGAQPGHPPHPKLLLPPEQVNHTEHLNKTKHKGK